MATIRVNSIEVIDFELFSLSTALDTLGYDPDSMGHAEKSNVNLEIDKAVQEFLRDNLSVIAERVLS